jgi:hypothetical protein
MYDSSVSTHRTQQVQAQHLYAFYSSSAIADADATAASSAAIDHDRDDDFNDDVEEEDRRYSATSKKSSKTNDGLDKLRVTELKRLLSERGIDFRDCIEKRDLVDRLREFNNNSSFSSYYDSSSNSSSRRGRQGNNGPLSGLSNDELSLINTFKRVSPSVANIKTTTIVQTRQGWSLKPMEVPVGTGSGFLWDDQGHVVTNYHVVSAGRKDGKIPDTVSVKLAGLPDARDADVVGVEPEKDLAVLRVRSRRNLPRPIDVGTSNDLQVGQTVSAIGNPFGLDDTLTKGIISALGRDVDGIGGRPIHGCIQTDASINQGEDTVNGFIWVLWRWD